MPYIKDKEDRKFLDDFVITFISQDQKMLCNDLAISFSSHFNFVGNLNYFLFKLAKNPKVIYYDDLIHFLFELGKINCKCYADYQSFIGELICARKEIQRRLRSDHLLARYLDIIASRFYLEIIAPYEDKKIKENGDVK